MLLLRFAKTFDWLLTVLCILLNLYDCLLICMTNKPITKSLSLLTLWQHCVTDSTAALLEHQEAGSCLSSFASLYFLSDSNHIFCIQCINCKGSNLGPRLPQFWKIYVREFKATDTDYQQHHCNSSAQSSSPSLVRGKKAWAWPCATDSELHNTSTQRI